MGQIRVAWAHLHLGTGLGQVVTPNRRQAGFNFSRMAMDWERPD